MPDLVSIGFIDQFVAGAGKQTVGGNEQAGATKVGNMPVETVSHLANRVAVTGQKVYRKVLAPCFWIDGQHATNEVGP